MKNYTFFILVVAVFSIALSGCTGASDSGASGGSGGGSNGGNSIAGSTATMLPYGDILYVLDAGQLKAIDLTLDPPDTASTQPLSNPETLFIYEDYLYVGGQFGVEILDLSEPLLPKKVSSYQHFRSCDPIVVSNDIGYVTLRGNFSNRCQLNGVNRLELVDMSNPKSPRFISDYAMSSPYGLAKADNFLAVCQEAFGLSLIDVSDPQNISETANFSGINCFDLIFHDQRLIATASDGIYQFAAEDEFLDQLSVIPVGQNIE